MSLTSAVALRKFVREHSTLHFVHNNQPFIHTLRALHIHAHCPLSHAQQWIRSSSSSRLPNDGRTCAQTLAILHKVHFAMLVRAHSHSACLSNVQPPCTVLLSPGSSNVPLLTTWTIALRPPVSRSAMPTSLRSAYPYRYYRNMREKFSSIICSVIL